MARVCPILSSKDRTDLPGKRSFNLHITYISTSEDRTSGFHLLSIFVLPMSWYGQPVNKKISTREHRLKVTNIT